MCYYECVTRGDSFLCVHTSPVGSLHGPWPLLGNVQPFEQSFQISSATENGYKLLLECAPLLFFMFLLFLQLIIGGGMNLKSRPRGQIPVQYIYRMGRTKTA